MEKQKTNNRIILIELSMLHQKKIKSGYNGIEIIIKKSF